MGEAPYLGERLALVLADKAVDDIKRLGRSGGGREARTAHRRPRSSRVRMRPAQASHFWGAEEETRRSYTTAGLM